MIIFNRIEEGQSFSNVPGNHLDPSRTPEVCIWAAETTVGGFLASGNVTTRAVSQVFSKNTVPAIKDARRRLLQAEAEQAVRDMASDNDDDPSQR